MTKGGMSMLVGGAAGHPYREGRAILAGHRRAHGYFCAALLILLAQNSGPESAEASPAMTLDDSDTVGAGQIEIVVAAAAFERGTTLSYEAPVLDISLGLADRLDLTLVGSPTHGEEDSESLPTQGNLSLGLKWQYLRRPSFRLSVHPAIDINVRDTDNLVIHFPAQFEYRQGRLLWGIDADYAVVTDSPNQWRAGTWVGWSLKKSLLLLGEVGALTANEPDSVDFGFGLGAEWLTPLGVTVLASAGTDFAAFGAERIKWRGFFGLLWTSKLWHATAANVRPNRPRRIPEKSPGALRDGLRGNP